MAKILYEDKEAIRGGNLPNKNKVTAEDLNEIKESVNYLYDNGALGDSFWTIDLMDVTTGDVFAPFAMQIDSIANVFADPTLTITVNDLAYTFGDAISLGAKITFTIGTQGVNNVYFTKL